MRLPVLRAWGPASPAAQAAARELAESERAAAVAVRQLWQDMRDEKAAHEEAVKGGVGGGTY
jgi:hypothetical protein